MDPMAFCEVYNVSFDISYLYIRILFSHLVQRSEFCYQPVTDASFVIDFPRINERIAMYRIYLSARRL